jgi:hypothetical protein
MSFLLSPFTDIILRLFGIGPFWILYLGTVVALIGLVLEASDKTMILGIVAGMIRTFTNQQGPIRVKVSPSVARRVGFALLLTGIVLATAGTDAMASSPGSTLINYYGGGSSTIISQNACDGVSRIFGRCETGTGSCTINTGGSSCTSEILYPTPFTNTPFPTYFLTSNLFSVLPIGTMTFASPHNSTILLDGDTNDNSSTITNFDEHMKSYSLATNVYSSILVRSTGYVVCTSLSTNQNIQIKIKVGPGAYGNSAYVNCPAGVSTIIPYATETEFQQLSNATIFVTVGALNNDPNTTVSVNNEIIQAELDGNIWFNFPSASTELFSSTNYRLNFSNIFSVISRIHVRVIQGGVTGNEALQLQRSTNAGVTWINVSGCSITFGTGTGDFYQSLPACFAVAANSVNGVMYRMMGSGGNGAGDNPVFAFIYVEIGKSIMGITPLQTVSTTTGFTTIWNSIAVFQTTFTITFVWKSISESG